mmetsp:Transcript_75888/g.214598  ORF Transcript_75888/g.214598 Transcript_75888/m.214598 type:complete len:229 (-) Transcript_75888:111-797(-)
MISDTSSAVKPKTATGRSRSPRAGRSPGGTPATGRAGSLAGAGCGGLMAEDFALRRKDCTPCCLIWAQLAADRSTSSSGLLLPGRLYTARSRGCHIVAPQKLEHLMLGTAPLACSMPSTADRTAAASAASYVPASSCHTTSTGPARPAARRAATNAGTASRGRPSRTKRSAPRARRLSRSASTLSSRKRAAKGPVLATAWPASPAEGRASKSSGLKTYNGITGPAAPA